MAVSRTERVSLGATPRQYGAWRNAAEDAGIHLTDWLRRAADNAAAEEFAARLRERERLAKLERQEAGV